MRKLTLIGFVLFSVAVITAPAFAKRNGWTDVASSNNRQAERVESLRLLLDLSPEQEAEIRKIILDGRKKAADHRENTLEDRQEVRELMASDTLNEQRLRELINVQAELKTNRMIHKHATRTAINEVLTPEQQEKRQVLQQIKRHRKGSHRWPSFGEGVKEM